MSAVEEFSRIESKFSELSRSSVDNLKREMQMIGEMLVGYIQTEKLSGQVLARRSGRLSASIESDTEEVADAIRTSVGSDGSVPYARAHEFGAVVSIPEYSGRLMVFRAKSGDLVFTRNRRAYTVTMPERSYVRSAVDDKLEEINSRIEKAVLRGVDNASN